MSYLQRGRFFLCIIAMCALIASPPGWDLNSLGWCLNPITAKESITVVETTDNTLVLEFNIPELRFEKREIEFLLFASKLFPSVTDAWRFAGLTERHKQQVISQTFDVVSFGGSAYLYENGNPQIPTYVKLVGIPADGSPSASIISTSFEIKSGYRLLPAQPDRLYKEDNRKPGSAVLSTEKRRSLPRTTVSETETLVIDEAFYRRNAFYPTKLVDIEPIGYIRAQRVARLRIHPIQYNPATEQLKVYTRMRINITFPHVFSAPARNPKSSTKGSKFFEPLFQNSLLNYTQSKSWRVRQNRSQQIQSAPGLNVTVSEAKQSEIAAYKLFVNKTGIYKLTQPQLRAAGANFTDVDARTLKLSVEGNEVQIYVHGEQDGNFDETDYILFYGREIKNNKFTNTNVYRLSWGGRAGRRVLDQGDAIVNTETPGEVNIPQIPTAFKTLAHFEKDRAHDELVNVKSELVDHYFWTGFTGQIEKKWRKNITFDLPKVAKGLGRKPLMRVRFQGISYRKNELHKASVWLNGGLILTAEWNGQTALVVEREFHPVFLSYENRLIIDCEDNNGTPPNQSDFMLDWFELEYWHTFEAEDGRLEFSSDTVPPVSGAVQYNVSEFYSPNIDVYQISESEILARIVNTDIHDTGDKYTVSFEDNVIQLTRYYAVQSSSYMRVSEIIPDKPSNLRDPAHKADYIIISHQDFLKDILPLASHRRAQGHDVVIFDVEDIYDEFSHGVFNPRAIQSFLRYAYHNWDKQPEYVLLVGDAHYDYKRSAVENYHEMYGIEYPLYPIFVPTYHGWSPEGGETAMDHRFVTVSGDDVLPDMAIGRLPVHTASELREVVDKIMAYDQSLKSGSWRTRIMQIADDAEDHVGDEEFERSRERLAKDFIPLGYDVQKVYLRKIQSPIRTNQMIIKNINDGVVALEYAGHGGGWTWADQNIFRGEDIQTLRNKDKYPFVITTTCLNGFFDKPAKFGEHNILSEAFLLAPQRGAAAVLSATRLTYAAANSSFDEELFTEMFDVKPPEVGLIILQAKVNFIAKHTSLLWIPGAEQYTLFGDPAMRLALPELDIVAELEEVSLDSSKELVIKRNIVGRYHQSNGEPHNDLLVVLFRKPSEAPGVGERSEQSLRNQQKFEKAEDFSTENLIVSVVYPNNLDDNPNNDIPIQQKTVPIWKGDFGDIRLDIPANVISGEGIVRLFAQNENTSAVGGTRFSMRKPVIVEHRYEMTDTTLKIFVKIVDNQGTDGIKLVQCLWKNTTDFKQKSTDMTISKSSGDGEWYELKTDIPLPRGGQSVKYRIAVSDTEDNYVETEMMSVMAPIGANLAIAQDTGSLAPQIFYAFSKDKDAWTISAKLVNNGGKPMTQDIPVYFFDGNPDLNGDAIIDEEASILSYVNIQPEYWQPDVEFLQTTFATITLTEPLSSGLHQIYVWADPELPEYDHGDRIIGTFEEPLYFDNKLTKLFRINDFILRDEDLNAHSLNRVMDVFIPRGAAEPTTVSISDLTFPVYEQPGILPAPSPTITGKDAFTIEFQSGINVLEKEAKIQFRFDVHKLRKKLWDELRFPVSLNKEQEALLQEKVQEAAKSFSIYAWGEERLAWKMLPSEMVLDNDGNFEQRGYVTSSVAENSNDTILGLSHIKIDSSLTPTGEWIILFLDKTRYEVLLKREGMTKEEKLGRTGKVGELYKDESVGLELNIPVKRDVVGNQINFEYGDIFTFTTHIAPDGAISIANLRNSSNGDGSAHIELLEDDDNSSLQTGNWLIFFRNSQRYELRDELNQTVLYTYGTPVTGKVNERLRLPHIGVAITVNAGERPFKFGDKIKYSTAKVGMVTTNTKKLGAYALMQNDDHKPPRVRLWVNGNPPDSGSVIPPRPQISILLEDINGIDIDSISFTISKNDGALKPVDESTYTVGDQLISVPVRYTPILHIGKYIYHISVRDLNNNITGTPEEPFVEFVFFVEEEPDLTPPDINVTVNGAPLFDDDTLHHQPQFDIRITDEHGIRPYSILLWFGQDGEPLEQLELWRHYRLDYTPTDPTKAILTYSPDLPNGEYHIQVEATDTSKNHSFLDGDDSTPYRFVLDEDIKIDEIINAPNPFERDTVFTYMLTQEPDDVIIKIYTVTGRLIKTLEHILTRRGYNEVYWDGRDEQDNRLANGVYFYKVIVQIEGSKIEKYEKLAILR